MKTVCFDIGTSRSRACDSEGKVFAEEPSEAAVGARFSDASDDERSRGEAGDGVFCAGVDALRYSQRLPGAVSLVRAFKCSVVSDEDAARALFARLAEDVGARGSFRALAAVPCDTGEYEKFTIDETLRAAGAKSVALIEKPVAASIGAGLDIEGNIPFMIADLGAGTSELAVIRQNEYLSALSLRLGGDDIDEAIISYAAENSGVTVTKKTAEAFKRRFISLMPNENGESALLPGNDAALGLPTAAEVEPIEITRAIFPLIVALRKTFETVLAGLKPEEAAALSEIVMTGGGAKLGGLPEYIAERVGLPVSAAKFEGPSAVLAGLRSLANSPRRSALLEFRTARRQ